MVRATVLRFFAITLFTLCFFSKVITHPLTGKFLRRAAFFMLASQGRIYVDPVVPEDLERRVVVVWDSPSKGLCYQYGQIDSVGMHGEGTFVVLFEPDRWGFTIYRNRDLGIKLWKLAK
ncbi:hypothetical protein HN446_02255 [bacterium]|jgi:hypothetical protein|nr:hypothetical protein [bacterium]